MVSFLESLGVTEEDLIDNYIRSTYIVDFGVIVEVLDIDVVRVQPGACDKNNHFTSYTCILGSACSSNMTVKVDPVVGDKVLVFFPKQYHEDMLNPETKGTVFNSAVSGYSVSCGIAFLANQFFESSYAKNILHIADKELNVGVTDKDISVEINPDKENKTYKAKLSVSSTGKAVYEIKDKVILKVEDTGAFSLVANNKYEIMADASGNITLDAKAGKIDVKNTAGGSLGKILSDIFIAMTTGDVTTPQGAGTFGPGIIAKATQANIACNNLLVGGAPVPPAPPAPPVEE